MSSHPPLSPDERNPAPASGGDALFALARERLGEAILETLRAAFTVAALLSFAGAIVVWTWALAG